MCFGQSGQFEAFLENIFLVSVQLPNIPPIAKTKFSLNKNTVLQSSSSQSRDFFHCSYKQSLQEEKATGFGNTTVVSFIYGLSPGKS